jgi:hypothetical protein
MSLACISGSLIQHSGHPLTTIDDVVSLGLIHRDITKYCTIKSRKSPEGLSKGKKPEK